MNLLTKKRALLSTFSAPFFLLPSIKKAIRGKHNTHICTVYLREFATDERWLSYVNIDFSDDEIHET